MVKPRYRVDTLSELRLVLLKGANCALLQCWRVVFFQKENIRYSNNDGTNGPNKGKMASNC